VNGFLWVLLACVIRGQMIENESAQEVAAPVVEAPATALPWVRDEGPALA